MKICLIADTHFGIKNDNLVFQKYFQKFYEDLFFPYIENNNIKTVVHLGDLVDRRKFVNYVTLSNIRTDFILQLHNYGIDTHVLVGNHDTYYRNTNRVNAISELLGNLSFVSIYDKPEDVNLGGLDICMMPWICLENFDECMEKIKTTTSQVLMGHLELQGFLMQKGVYSENGLTKEDFKNFDVVYSGHFHYKSSLDGICYLGSPYELSWADFEVDKGFHIFDTETRELEFIKNPYRLFHKIYYDETIDYTNHDLSYYTDTYIKLLVKNKTDAYAFDKFLNRLYEVSPQDINIIEESELFFEGDDSVYEAEDTLTILSKYIDGLSIDLDKSVLDGLLKNIYTEAVDII